MADTFAKNYLRRLMENPGTFTGTPGYQFALDQGTQAINRRAAAGGGRGSGNVLAEAAKYATGLATQDYGGSVERALRAAGLEQEGNIAGDRLALDRDLGEGSLDLGRGRLALDDRLGTGQLDLGRGRLALDDRLGTGRLHLERELGAGELNLGRDRLDLDGRRADQDFGVNMFRATNDYNIGSRGIEAGREGRWWDYDLGRGRLALDTTRAENDFSLSAGRLDVDRFDAGTRRGAARSTDFLGRDAARRAWEPFGDPYRSGDRRPSWLRGAL